MALVPSNLGQLLGRAYMAATAPELSKFPLSPNGKRTGLTASIRATLTAKPAGLTAGQISAITGIESSQVVSLMMMMKDVEHDGPARASIWRLKPAEEPAA